MRQGRSGEKMAIRKFAAPTTREAMIQVRRELGDDAVIIANRRVGNRIEILAAAPDAVDALVERSEVRAAPPMREGSERATQREQVREPSREQGREQNREPARQKVEAFQDFVRRQMQSDNEVPAQPRVAREMPLRANAERAAIAPNNNAGVAMYHDVADIEDDESYVPEQQPERAAMRAAVPAVARRAPATAPVREDAAPRRQPQPTQPSHRAQQIESLVTPADPAVFRRRPAHVAAPARIEQPAGTTRPAPVAPTIDIVLEPQPVPQPVVQQNVQPIVAAAPVVPQPETRTAPSEPVATGHAPVPSLPPLRSQAGPIATAARMREASILAAAEMTAAMQPVHIDTPRAMAVAPVALVAPAAPVAPVMQQPVVPAAPAIEKAPAAPAIAGWSWQAQFVPAPAVAAAPVVATPSAAPVQVQAAPVQPAVEAPVQPVVQAHVQAPIQVSAPLVEPVSVEPVRPAQPEGESRVLAELQSMRDMLRQQIATLATKPAPEAVPPTAPATRVMTRLLTAGFSVEVARRIASHVPQHVDVVQAETWLNEVLAHNVRCADAAEGIVERAGQPGTPGQIFALVGPTGVGKTTTVAKLAARFAVRHGTSALGLITLDAYRVAAPEQLRAYGRILGTPVHLAQDSATLRELLSTMVHKRLVLIDTCGVSQRDERLAEMLDLLATSGTATRPIQRVLLLNSASHAETLDETARAWRAQDCTGAILTKLDEATRIGGSLDASLRHRLTLLGVTNGQRVPEDWHAANSKLLAHLALKPAAQLFELADEEGAALVLGLPAAHGALHG